MSNYIITTDGELYHHGVKGMKWGVRKKRDMKVAKRFARAGKLQGRSDYYREQAKAAYKKHDDAAKVMDKTAKKYESQGSYVKAELARKSAQAMRARGANVKAKGEAEANRLLAKAQKSQEKASTYATKKRVDLGKSVLDNIMKDSRSQGYNKAKANADAYNERRLNEALGDRGYEIANAIRGR